MPLRVINTSFQITVMTAAKIILSANSKTNDLDFFLVLKIFFLCGCVCEYECMSVCIRTKQF